jgi:hypothetical protein
MRCPKPRFCPPDNLGSWNVALETRHRGAMNALGHASNQGMRAPVTATPLAYGAPLVLLPATPATARVHFLDNPFLGYRQLLANAAVAASRVAA